MKVGVPKEIVSNERRVALAPDIVKKLIEAGVEVLVEKGAGEAASLLDSAYQEAGCKIVADAAAVYKDSDVILKVQKPEPAEVKMLKEGTVFITSLQPLVNHDLVKELTQKKVTSFSMDAIPRISRAQRMDSLSSMSSIAGYEAVLIGASKLGKYMPMMMTAAATMPPAKVLVLGAGVAGLQAIATARRLGALVEAFDVRPVVKEQVESLGATFVELEETADAEDAGGYAKELSADHQQREVELISKHAMASDVVITTALIPGRPAPVLITKEAVAGMKTGSVIVDLAAETGGNCELTKPGEETVENGVIICGPLNLASDMAMQASQLYSRNISGLLLLMINEGQLNLDFEDAIIDGCCVTHAGEIRGVFKDQIK
ncbi:MAG: Re/Si-specific NAD(P)(+) transhydrogenase subunit alpha [Dehalococcoidales bacterium]|jgi:NAD(P) transhydrogenase subunit alpha|nr:NAD(P)(+) transhydrogenase (Re/Si-specific) subunit alpha [Dehalococcoidales bacterium]MDP6824547.1 Re/Si-specific NAD(P)(+) transhydrogenase subunit alpha [Dehalococcoidales bacterium]